MDTSVVVALIGGWTTIIAGLIDVRRRVNGQMDTKFEAVKEEVREVKFEMIDVKSDIRDMKSDIRCISNKIHEED